MTKYVALLRGIAPMNPAMRNENLRQVFESIGFTSISTVIASGNVIFATPRHDVAALESEITEALHEQLGFWSTAVIRSRTELQDLVAADPFTGQEHNPRNYLIVTFAKHALPKVAVKSAPGATVKALRAREICTVVNLTAAHTPNQMALTEKQFGKEITTRTWKTVQRIVQKMSEPGGIIE